MSEATLPPDINRRLESLIRIGRVTKIDHAAGKCRVKTGELETEWLPWLERREGTTNDWDPPTAGEQCLVLSPSGETAGGIVLLGIPSDAFPQPTHDKNFWKRVFPDGAWVQHNHEQSQYQIKVGGTTLTLMPGATILQTPFFLVDTPLTEFTGMVQIDSLLHVCADTLVDGNVIIGGSDIAAGVQIDGGGNTNHHSHSAGGFAEGEVNKKVKPPKRGGKPPTPTGGTK